MGAAAQRQLFEVAHDLETALLVCIVGGADDNGPEVFQATARLE
ncbi:MAG: hypothetical protein OXN97_23020 [Bryobacterales bacterium]|nr:hypothetical protein [Bryobacterales bacterium]